MLTNKDVNNSQFSCLNLVKYRICDGYTTIKTERIVKELLPSITASSFATPTAS